MSIKAGQILHAANGFLVDRIQTGGAGNLNIPKESIYELGNFKTVAIVRDIPDLSFDLETFDVSTEIEALVTGVDPTTVVAGQEFNFDNAKPLDVISPFKAGNNLYGIVKGIAVPYLTVEQSVYRFGVRANATESHTLRGDAIYYIPGTPYYEEFTAAGTGPYALAHTALPYTESGSTFHVLGLCYLATDGTYKRLFHGSDFTDTTGNFTLVVAPPAGAKIRAVYGSATAATYAQSVHPSTAVKPAAVRAKNIDLYVGTTAATPVFSRWTGVQSVELTRRVTLQNDEEFGNVHYVAQDYDTPSVTGRIGLKPLDPGAFFDKVAQIAGVTTSEVAGPNSSVTVPIEVRISHPDTGAVLKTLYVPDARFTAPPVQGRVQQKFETQIDLESDTGSLLVYSGVR